MSLEVQKLLGSVGQEHLLRFWGEMAESDRQSLEKQIAEIDFQQLQRLVHGKETPIDWRALAGRAEPPPAIGVQESTERVRRARKLGEDALRTGDGAQAHMQWDGLLVAL